MLPSVLSFVASHPLAEGTELKGLTIKHVIAAELIEPQNDLSAGIPPKGTVQKRVPDRFVDGKLFLGRTKEIAVEIEPPYADEETTASSNQELHGLSSATRSQVQQEPITETSRTRGWNFAGLLPTAQSVKNFIPFSTIRTISATGAAIPPVLPTREELDIYRPNPNPIAFTQGPDLQGNAGDGAQTEPHPGNYDMDMHDAPALEAAATGLAKRNHKERMQKLLLTKGQAEEKQQLKKMREELKAQTEKLAREKARLEKEKAEFEEKRAKAEAAQTERQVPGTKRKRLPSPDVGPPPPSVTYCLNYEDFSSDEEEDEGEEARAQRQTPTKRPRIDGPDEIKGDRHNAQPYTGERFALLKTPTISHGNNLFGKETSAEDADPPEFDRPKTGCSNTFKVPSPGDSGRENTELFLDEDDSIQNAHSAGAISSQSTFQTSPLASKQNQPRPAAGPSAAETSKSMAPPPRPSPSHASLPPTLPTFGRPAFVLDPVEKARQKALKHQPVTGSRLRESSRLSTSTIGSDAGDEPSPTSDEYDPKHPAIHAPTLSNTLPDALPWPGYVNAFEEWKKSVSPRVVGVVETSWNNVGDSKTAEYEFDQNMADFEAIESGGDVERSRGNSAVDVEGAAFDGEENGWGISPRVQEFIDARWMPEDEQVAENEFDMGMASWGAGLGVFA